MVEILTPVPNEGPWEAADALFEAQTTLAAVKAPKAPEAKQDGDVLDAFLAGF